MTFNLAFGHLPKWREPHSITWLGLAQISLHWTPVIFSGYSHAPRGSVASVHSSQVLASSISNGLLHPFTMSETDMKPCSTIVWFCKSFGEMISRERWRWWSMECWGFALYFAKSLTFLQKSSDAKGNKYSSFQNTFFFWKKTIKLYLRIMILYRVNFRCISAQWGPIYPAGYWRDASQSHHLTGDVGSTLVFEVWVKGFCFCSVMICWHIYSFRINMVGNGLWNVYLVKGFLFYSFLSPR